MKALVTRPEEDAAALIAALKSRGIDGLSAPMLAIVPQPDGAAQLAGAMAGVQAVLFTSANGARHFADASSRFDVPAFCVGDASAAAARLAGFRTVFSADGNVADLAALAISRLAPHQGPLLHATGAELAGDLAASLGARGFMVRRVELYRAEEARALAPDIADAIRRGEVALALFFSPRTGLSFVRLARDAGIGENCREMTAFALSQNVAAAVNALPWREISRRRFAAPKRRAGVARRVARGQELTMSEPQQPPPEDLSVQWTRVEPKPEPAAPPSPSRMPSIAPAQRAIAWLVLILVVVLALVASSPYWAPSLASALPWGRVPTEDKSAEAVTALQSQLDQSQARVKALSDRVAKLESAGGEIKNFSRRGSAPSKRAPLKPSPHRRRPHPRRHQRPPRRSPIPRPTRRCRLSKIKWRSSATIPRRRMRARPSSKRRSRARATGAAPTMRCC